ncbi:ribonuclease H-like domain-containing protein [Fomitopsis serialis]|uniref:ribonuclease H-like domain-containing protein n=1 Tax=Fomitopsis serialis TaxID=139415 RepID=UPI002008AF47|nr:ribonuclease H-like domain-containing protein [Neoantrodia serialis]KAH9933419.1 ribonuclease H-like domain-containing protein [Neoantrodia serialis]
MADRSRRERKSKLDKLAEYKRAREGGGRTWKEEKDVELYDEVSEDQYKSIVRGRLAKDDFVVDDGVQGYMDNGVDDFEEVEEQQESEDEHRAKGKNRKAAPKAKAKGKPKAPPPAVTPSLSSYRPKASEEQEADLMTSLFDLMDKSADQIIQPTKSRKRKPVPEPDYREASSSPTPYARPRPAVHSYRGSFADVAGSSSDGILDDGPNFDDASSDDLMLSPKKKLKTDNEAIAPAIERMSQMEVYSASSGTEDCDSSFDDINMNDFMDIDDAELNGEASKPIPQAKGSAKTEIDVESKPLLPIHGKLNAQTKKKQDETPSWLSVYESLQTTTDDSLGQASASRSSASHGDVSVLEEDGSLRFFWIDYLEHEGKVYFVGKTQDKVSKAWYSCCVTVENLQRNLFLLPRERRMEEDEETGKLYETDVKPEMSDVYADFDRIRKAMNIKAWKGKAVKRNYAFGENDIPRGENDWLKVVYGFDEPQIHSSVCSPNIAKIMGTSTSAFELLVLKRKIMGPCWLQVKKPQLDHKGVSWCKVEATVSDPKDFQPISDRDPTAPKANPPLTVMSLSIRTIVNHKENNREIVCATVRIWSNIDLDDPTPPESLPCTVRTFVRPLDRFPPNFEVRAGKNGKGVISPMKNERMLLNSLLATVYKADPDIIVGHEVLGVSLDVLLHRMRDLKADHWSRIGRFRRSKWPSIGRQGTNLKFMNGRLLCDLASDSAKGMISSTTWSLTEMCKTHLKSDRQDIDPDDTASFFDSSVSSPERLLTFVRHCELDAHYQMALAAKVQILPLTRQLTNLAGNSWNKTLNGGRAERNEYILLHEFHQRKYICPDKTWGKKAAAAEKETRDDDAEGGKTTKSKRDKYKGGLVFEPKRGLWDKFILWDIKQMALKLTANSMYGCLGFEYSRFYADPGCLDDLQGPSAEISAAFKKTRLLLLQKKKYAAIKVEDGTRTSTEIKGLDMKRREYSALSKNVSHDRVVVEKIHEYLTTVGEDVRAGKVKLDDFIIFKRLGKNPEDYPDAKSQPHVQVALRMKARGGTARSGDVIPYVFCLGENGESAKSAQADKAKHPDEVRKTGSGLKTDYEYYLSQQILPPVERLCEPIEGTDRARLAECLGLDASRYRTSTTESEERQFSTLDSLMSDAERYKDAEPFVVRCRSCQGHVAFEPISDRENSLLLSAGPTCPACKTALRTASLQTQLETQIRARVARYYEGGRCGHVAFEYSDAQLYTQLRYYASLFSPEGALKACGAAKQKQGAHHLPLIVPRVYGADAEFLRVMGATVDKYLDQSGRRWVNLTGLFSFMKI